MRLGRSTLTEELVAIKELKPQWMTAPGEYPDDDFSDSTRHEASMLRRVAGHPNIIKLLDARYGVEHIRADESTFKTNMLVSYKFLPLNHTWNYSNFTPVHV